MLLDIRDIIFIHDMVKHDTVKTHVLGILVIFDWKITLKLEINGLTKS